MGARSASATAGVWGLLVVMAGASGCAMAQAHRAPGPPDAPAPPAGETLVMLRDLSPGQPLVAFGRQRDLLTPEGPARLRDAVVREARRRGLARVRSASAPVPPAPAARPEGAVWGDNVATAGGAETASPGPTPPPGATWLELTSLVLDQARLAEGPGATVMTLEVTAVRTAAPAADGDPRAVEVRFTLADLEPQVALDAAPGEGARDALGSATTRLLERAAGRLASLLVPAAESAVETDPGEGHLSEADPGPVAVHVVPLEASYVARHWVVAPVPSGRGRAAAGGAIRGASAGGHLALLGAFCGPFAPACMAALGLVGGGVGLVVGAVAGAAGAPSSPPSGTMRAALPPEPERSALLALLRRQAEGASLAAEVERAAHRAVEAIPGAGGPVAPPRLARVEVRLTGDEGPDHPARLALVVTTAPPPGHGGPDVLELETPDPLSARTWADDGGAVLRLVLARAAGQAGAALVARDRQAAPPAGGGGDAAAGRALTPEPPPGTPAQAAPRARAESAGATGPAPYGTNGSGLSSL